MNGHLRGLAFWSAGVGWFLAILATCLINGETKNAWGVIAGAAFAASEAWKHWRRLM